MLNSGSVGGGGTGNLAEAGGDIGLARVTYTRLPAFVPRAADLVQIDPGDGEAQARRFRLDDPRARSRRTTLRAATFVRQAG